ncbi:reticulon-1-like isoform X2 [Rhincodon typus]|uniref:reticulon-1-like isoform X2 n=1 Tax=Rhincodon typus TaxID=259920 RepID=UPI00202E648D|nr:reticulon-1-like isoform X2 [Rhincodon typus]
MGLHHLGQVMGQVLGFGHCKSASTVSTTPDSTPSSTEGASEDFLEPQTAQEHSDDDLLTDSSLYWGTPRQMSLESMLSCGTPLGQQPSCFPGGFPSSGSPELPARGLEEATHGPGRKRPSKCDAAQTTKEKCSVPRGVVRTETIETFLAEEEDELEAYHVHVEVAGGHWHSVEQEIMPEPRDSTDGYPLQSSSEIPVLESIPIHQDPEEDTASESRLEMEPQEEGRLKGSPELGILPMEESGSQKDAEVFEAQTMEVETDSGRWMEDLYSDQTKPGQQQEASLSSKSGVGTMTEEEGAPSASSLQPVTEAENMVVELEVIGAAGVEIATETTKVKSLTDTVETVGSRDGLEPVEVMGTVEAMLPGACDCSVYTDDTIVCQHSLTPVTVPSVNETQEVTDVEMWADNWQSPRQPSAFEQSDHPKSQGLEAVDQSVTDLLYWEDVKKTGTVFGAIILILFSLTQFSGISVLAYLTLSVLSVTISLRLYTSALHLIYKTQEVHPFQVYLDLDIALSQEQMRKYFEVTVLYVTSAISHLRRLFLVGDLLDSLKFGVLLWLMTYVGAIFNGLTLTILATVAIFIVPLVYRKHKVHINQYLGLVRGQIKEFTAKIQAKLPGSKPKAE